jgi:hypothetical protein
MFNPLLVKALIDRFDSLLFKKLTIGCWRIQIGLYSISTNGFQAISHE